MAKLTEAVVGIGVWLITIIVIIVVIAAFWEIVLSFAVMAFVIWALIYVCAFIASIDKK